MTIVGVLLTGVGNVLHRAASEPSAFIPIDESVKVVGVFGMIGGMAMVVFGLIGVRTTREKGTMVLSNKTAPVLSVKAAPLTPAAEVWSVRRAPISQFNARSFLRVVVGMSGCGAKLSTLGRCGSAGEFDGDGDQRVGHRRMGWHRLGCCPQQDVRWRKSKLLSEPLAKQDQGLGQW
jgi:hypothetical protein